MSETANDERPSFLSEEEDITLKEIRSLRMGLTKILTRDEDGKLVLPKSTSDKVLLTGLLDGVEREVLTRARLKVSSDDVGASKDLKGAIADAYKSFAGRNRPPALPEERHLPDIIRPEGIVPGEMDIGHLPLTMADIMKDEQ